MVTMEVNGIGRAFAKEGVKVIADIDSYGGEHTVAAIKVKLTIPRISIYTQSKLSYNRW